MPTSSKKPQPFAWAPVPDPEGGLAQTLRPVMVGIERNFNNVQASIRQIIAYFDEVISLIPANLIARLTAIEKGRIATYTTDPGDPPVGKSMQFVLVDTGVSATLVTRNNDNGTVREFTQALT